VDNSLIEAIQSLYRGHCAKILINGEFSDSHKIEVGVKQGCTLSPILFSTFINEFPKYINNLGLGVQLSSDVILSIPLFADGIILMTESEESLQQYALELEKFCDENGLKVNTKDQYNGYCWITVSKLITYKNNPLDNVKSYKYLGVQISDDLEWDVHLISIKDLINSESHSQ